MRLTCSDAPASSQALNRDPSDRRPTPLGQQVAQAARPAEDVLLEAGDAGAEVARKRFAEVRRQERRESGDVTGNSGSNVYDVGRWRTPELKCTEVCWERRSGVVAEHTPSGADRRNAAGNSCHPRHPATSPRRLLAMQANCV